MFGEKQNERSQRGFHKHRRALRDLHCQNELGWNRKVQELSGKRIAINQEGSRRVWNAPASGRSRGERGWGHGIRRINGAEKVLDKREMLMRERALSVLSWDYFFLTPLRGGAVTAASLCQKPSGLPGACSWLLPNQSMTHLCSTFRERGRSDFKGGGSVFPVRSTRNLQA